jgi:hypothetical protein
VNPASSEFLELLGPIPAEEGIQDRLRPNNGAEPARPKPGPVFGDLRDIVARDIEWLDRPFLPAGELVTNSADGGTGKGLLSVYYAARISRGELGARRTVVFAVAEDAFDTVLKPRLLAADADLDHVKTVSWQNGGYTDAIRIPDHIEQLETCLQAMDAALLVIDPLLSHLSGRTDSYKDHEVKAALRPLVLLAQRTGCTVLGNGHFGKDKTRGAVSSAQGSNAFTNTPRVALAMARDDEDDNLRVVEVVKSNIAGTGEGRNYRISTVAVEGLSEPVPVLTPDGGATKSVDELLTVKRAKRVPAATIRDLVLRELATGEKTRKHLDDVAKTETGANPDSVYKSALEPLRKEGRIKARKEGFGGDGGWVYTTTGGDLG